MIQNDEICRLEDLKNVPQCKFGHRMWSAGPCPRCHALGHDRDSRDVDRLQTILGLLSERLVAIDHGV